MKAACGNRNHKAQVDACLCMVDSLIEKQEWYEAWKTVNGLLKTDGDNLYLHALKRSLERAVLAEVNRELNRI